MSILFEWNAKKAALSQAKHGISFQEASTVFGDRLSITVDEPQTASGEFRFVTIGTSSAGRLLVVCHTERNGRIRIISGRKATRIERRQYETE